MGVIVGTESLLCSCDVFWVLSNSSYWYCRHKCRICLTALTDWFIEWLIPETAEIRNLPCPGPQLFDYMRNQSRQFNMSRFRMTASDTFEPVSCCLSLSDLLETFTVEPLLMNVCLTDVIQPDTLKGDFTLLSLSPSLFVSLSPSLFLFSLFLCFFSLSSLSPSLSVFSLFSLFSLSLAVCLLSLPLSYLTPSLPLFSLSLPIPSLSLPLSLFSLCLFPLPLCLSSFSPPPFFSLHRVWLRSRTWNVAKKS